MAKRRRIATSFLALACLVILICMTQRIVSLHALQIRVSESALLITPSGSEQVESPLTSCELSSKSLLMASPLIFDSALFAAVILLLALTLPRALPLRFPPLREFSSPVLRIHLRNCVFRE